MNTYSILYTVQRVMTEWAHVSIPVTGEVVILREDGSAWLDTEKLARRAVELGSTPELVWEREDQTVRITPLQRPRNMDLI